MSKVIIKQMISFAHLSFHFVYSSNQTIESPHKKTSIKLGSTKETKAFRRVVDESCLVRVKRTTARLHKPFDIVFHGLTGKYNSPNLSTVW